MTSELQERPADEANEIARKAYQIVRDHKLGMIPQGAKNRPNRYYRLIAGDALVCLAFAEQARQDGDEKFTSLFLAGAAVAWLTMCVGREWRRDIQDANIDDTRAVPISDLVIDAGHIMRNFEYSMFGETGDNWRFLLENSIFQIASRPDFDLAELAEYVLPGPDYRMINHDED